MPDILFKLLKFALVGMSGLLIDFGTTYFLKEKIKINKFAANAAGFSLAATSNYTLNRIWTFQSGNPHILYEYSTFIIISLIGLGINTFILWLLIKKSGINFYFSKLIATIVTVIWNFTANFLITFN